MHVCAQQHPALKSSSEGSSTPPRQMTSIQRCAILHSGAASLMDALNFRSSFSHRGTARRAHLGPVRDTAMGLVVSGVWLHMIAPDQNALPDRSLRPRATQARRSGRSGAADRLADGCTVHHRQPARGAHGTALLNTADAAIRVSASALYLVIFSLYSLFRPALKPIRGTPRRAQRRRRQRPDRRR